jgi:hypothetical protein
MWLVRLGFIRRIPGAARSGTCQDVLSVAVIPGTRPTPGCTNASASTKGVEVQWNGKPG